MYVEVGERSRNRAGGGNENILPGTYQGRGGHSAGSQEGLLAQGRPYSRPPGWLSLCGQRTWCHTNYVCVTAPRVGQEAEDGSQVYVRAEEDV